MHFSTFIGVAYVSCLGLLFPVARPVGSRCLVFPCFVSDFSLVSGVRIWVFLRGIWTFFSL